MSDDTHASASAEGLSPRQMCPEGCGYEAAHCGCDLPIQTTLRREREQAQAIQRLTEERDALKRQIQDDEAFENFRRVAGELDEALSALTAERAQRERLEQELRDIYQHYNITRPAATQ
jgi:hypothetical protein